MSAQKIQRYQPPLLSRYQPKPNEQGISKVRLLGNHLDNAMGGPWDSKFTCGEYHLILKKNNGTTLDLNLADLLALARKAKLA